MAKHADDLGHTVGSSGEPDDQFGKRRVVVIVDLEMCRVHNRVCGGALHVLRGKPAATDAGVVSVEVHHGLIVERMHDHLRRRG